MGPFSAFLASVSWALGAAGYSKISKDHSAFAVNFSRALFALPLFVITALIFAKSWAVTPSQVGWYALSMFASYGLGDSLFLMSTRSLGLPGALAIASSYPLWTALFQVFIKRQPMLPLNVLGMLMTIAGVVLVILSGPRTGVRGKEDTDWAGHNAPRRRVIHGVVLAFATSFLWSMNSFSVSQAGFEVDPAVANSVRLTMGLLMSFVIGRIADPRSRVVLPFRIFKQYWWVFLLEAYAGSYVYVYGVANSPLAVGATLTSLAPVLSVPVALIMRLEKFSLRRTLGVCSVVAGVFFLLLK